MKGMLEKLAQFMDKHPEMFGKPQGKDSWSSELKEDNFLNGKESKQFGNAIDMMKEAMGGGASGTGGAQGGAQGGQNLDNALIPSGNGESTLNPSKKNELENVAKFMDQHPESFGKPKGKDTWLSELKENNHLDKNETNDFQKAIDMLKDIQGLVSGGKSDGTDEGRGIGDSQDTGGAGGAQGAGGSQGAGGGQGAVAPQGAGGAGGSEGAGGPQGAGGSQSSGDAGGKDLKDLLVPNGKGESYLNPSKKDDLEGVAKFMDQHPEIFGKPKDKDSWSSELKEDNLLDGKETKQFNKAIDMMKDVGAGEGAGKSAGAGGAGNTGGADSSGGNGGASGTGNTGGADGASATSGATGPGATSGSGQGEEPSLKDALVQTGKGDAYINPSKQKEAEEVAKFMDQHPEDFGKPKSKDSWLSELKEDNYLNKDENSKFSKAADMMQDARGAGAAGGANGGGGTPAPESNKSATESGSPAPGAGGSGKSDSSTSADAGKPPAGMPKEMWGDCVEAGKKTGVDPYVLAAQMEKESQFGKALGGSPSGGDGLMQVEPSTRAAYGSKFEEKMGHSYDHGSKKDQVAMAAVILTEKGGDTTNMLQKYNGGDNWKPGTADSYGREIKADEYAATVSARAEEMKKSAA